MIKQEDIEKRLTYRLLKSFEHQGTEYTPEDVNAGVEIEISEEQARVLLDQGIIEQN